VKKIHVSVEGDNVMMWMETEEGHVEVELDAKAAISLATLLVKGADEIQTASAGEPYARTTERVLAREGLGT
jgi:hypothetical protein